MLASIRPPCDSTARRATASPSPVPFARVVKNGSNNRSPAPGGPYTRLGSQTGMTYTDVGRSNGIMAGVAKQFTNAELKALSNYISGVDGDLQVVPQSRFR